jgi:hypothetical protein
LLIATSEKPVRRRAQAKNLANNLKSPSGNVNLRAKLIFTAAGHPFFTGQFFGLTVSF